MIQIFARTYISFLNRSSEGQFKQINANISQISFLKRGFSVGAIVGSRVYSNTRATLFTHYPTVWTVTCSVVGTGVLVVVTIARDHPFYPVGQFRRICAGHKFPPFLLVGRLCDNCFLNHSTVFFLKDATEQM